MISLHMTDTLRYLDGARRSDTVTRNLTDSDSRRSEHGGRWHRAGRWSVKIAATRTAQRQRPQAIHVIVET